MICDDGLRRVSGRNSPGSFRGEAMSTELTISLVIPIYCEEDIITEFYKRAKAVMASLRPRYDHEFLFVNDGSDDRSLELLKDLSAKDPRVKVISLSRNFGHQFAITAGMDHALGDAVVVIDGDLQDPPEVIPQMVSKWVEGFKVVYGVREKRKGENLFKLATAKIFYRLLRLLSETEIPVDAGDFRLLDRMVVDALKSIREENRYLRGLVRWTGFRQTGLPYRRDPRFAGKTKFTVRKMIKFAVDGVLSFSDKPLKITSYFGFLITLLSFAMGLRIIIGKIRYPQIAVSGWTSMILAVLFIGGIQLISLGILGLYLGRQYREVKKRPLYIIADTFGFKNDIKP
jgi:polyisoprenyl-phosphate glycosyltransferase